MYGRPDMPFLTCVLLIGVVCQCELLLIFFSFSLPAFRNIISVGGLLLFLFGYILG